MAHARPFSTCTLQYLSNDVKNASRRGVLTPYNRTLKFWESWRTPKSLFWECERHPHTLPKVGLRQLPLWELESRWTPKFSKDNCRGQNSIDWGVPYIIEKFLERKCLKWVCMTHLDTSNTTFGQKKGRESNWQFDSRPLKVGNRLDFLVCRWHATYRWKVLIRATTLLQTSSQSEVCTQSCGPPKSRESQLWEFWDSHLRVLGQNDIWALVTWPSTKYIIRV
jgi:hypothetical protein